MAIALPASDQARHTRIVTDLMHSSCGDLMLDRFGNLCTRVTYDDNFKTLPWEKHLIGGTLAIITRFGWTLTACGAEYILENNIFEKRDLKFLRAISAARSDRLAA